VVPNSIGFVSLGVVNAKVNLVPIQGVLPTEQSVRDASYPLRREFFLATVGRPSRLEQAFLTFIYSPAGQAIVSRQYVPTPPSVDVVNLLTTLLAAIVVAALCLLLARGLWTLQNWARSAVMLILFLACLYFAVTVVFQVAAQTFGGETDQSLGTIMGFVLAGLVRIVSLTVAPAALIFALFRLEAHFTESAPQRAFFDRSVRYVLIASALSAIFIVFLIIVFTMMEAWRSIETIGVGRMLVGTIWRPTDQEFGVLPMIVGSVLSTLGAAILGVPLSVGTAILLTEIAPLAVREVIHPAIELLAGIPSVVYGLFGMVVLAPLIRTVDLPYNSGFGILNAAIILAVMILPTVATVSEDAIRSVPLTYKEASLALGATHWQTIWSVLLPAARSGILAAIILGIGRALGETMALIMVIGNSIAMPEPLNGNPLTILFSSARTLTGNIAVEINYASGVHRSSLFFTGVLLLAMILAVDLAARYLMRERLLS
jgi:phosphate transport system permease protein